jgi:cardiolipin synthase
MPIYKNTECTYFKSGEDYFESFVEELKKAKKFIFMETFILRQGKMWTTVFNILKAKAKEGVEIRFMYDDFGCINDIPINYKKHIEKYGIKCEVFNPIYPITTLAHNNRDHRKIVVIDGVIGYTGGANLADEYININSRFGHWKDSAIMIKGEAVKSFTLMFLETWHVFRDKDEDYSPFLSDIQLKEPSNSKKTKKAKKSKKSSQEMTKQISIFENIATVSKNNEFVQPYMTTPMDDEEIVARNVYVNILNSATEYVYITTPYLILDPELEEALLNAAKRSVDVRIITPGIPDKKYVFAVTRSEYYNLLKAGIKIYEYTPGFIHAKNVVADDMIATVGSINFDNRSFYHNYENGVLVYNSPVIADSKKDFLDTQKLSKQIEIEYNEKTPIRVKIKTAICRVLIPLI